MEVLNVRSIHVSNQLPPHHLVEGPRTPGIAPLTGRTFGKGTPDDLGWSRFGNTNPAIQHVVLASSGSGPPYGGTALPRGRPPDSWPGSRREPAKDPGFPAIGFGYRRAGETCRASTELRRRAHGSNLPRSEWRRSEPLGRTTGRSDSRTRSERCSPPGRSSGKGAGLEMRDGADE